MTVKSHHMYIAVAETLIIHGLFEKNDHYNVMSTTFIGGRTASWFIFCTDRLIRLVHS
jgi:hypothetical protein